MSMPAARSSCPVADTAFGSDDFRSKVPRLAEENRKLNQALVDLLASVGVRMGASPAQVALAWLLAQKPWIVPIPGTTNLARLEENIGAADVVLTAEDLREINEAAGKIGVAGARYPEAMMKMSGL